MRYLKMNLSKKPTKVYSKNSEKKAKTTIRNLHQFKTDSKRTWQVAKK